MEWPYLHPRRIHICPKAAQRDEELAHRRSETECSLCADHRTEAPLPVTNQRSIYGLLKDPEIVSHYHRDREPPPARANRPIEIDARLEEVERVMNA